MNAFQKCTFTADAVPLYLPQQLYLKPIAQITITIHLPSKLVGKSISNWELMEKLRSLISPDEFSLLKVSKNTIEFIRFHAEIDDKNKLQRIVNKIDNKLIKLKEFNDLFKARAFESISDFPNKHIWDSFFRDATDMDEMKPGERPDTIHISNLPVRWFVPYHLSGNEDIRPSEKIFYRVFEKFGRIRHVDIPICDPYRSKMKIQISGLQTFSFDDKDFFEGYVQFKDYTGFAKAMDAFRRMKLLHKDPDINETYMVNIKVDFDRTKHMSVGSLKRRDIVRERLIRKQKEKEEKEKLETEQLRVTQEVERQKELDEKKEKENRRHEREEHRKARILAQLEIKDADEINIKIAKEEKKLLKAQRKLEAIRLIEELFRRVKGKQENRGNTEKNLTVNDELSRYKKSSEKEFNSRQNNLHHSIAGRVVLKTILSRSTKPRKDSSSSNTSLSLEDTGNDEECTKTNEIPKEFPLLYPYTQMQNSLYPYFAPVGLPVRGQPYYPYQPKGRGYFKGAGPSRGFRRGRRGYKPNYRSFNKPVPYYPPELQVEYYRYFQKFLKGHDDRDSRSYSKSRSRSRSRSKRRSYSRSRRSHSRSRSRRSHTKSRSRSKSKKSRRSISSRSKRAKSSHGDRKHSKSEKSRSKSKSRRKSRSPSKASIDRLRNQRAKSWSLPTTSQKKKKRSWSRSPS